MTKHLKVSRTATVLGVESVLLEPGHTPTIQRLSSAKRTPKVKGASSSQYRKFADDTQPFTLLTPRPLKPGEKEQAVLHALMMTTALEVLKSYGLVTMMVSQDGTQIKAVFSLRDWTPDLELR